MRSTIGKIRFIEVYIDTPLEVCELRDPKGLYARARRGELRCFTGIDDPYEPPVQAEITLNTIGTTPEENALLIMDYLMHHGLL